jgi:peptidoglycan/LPS O-acetylase OafA/YrhL
MTGARTEYLPYIDGLQAVAVVSVFLYHLNANLLPGGFTGVDIFFVISGLVISGSVNGLEGISFGRFLANFYSRRLFRIAPALIVCLIVTALALDLFVPFARLSLANQKAGLAAFFGFSNYVLARSDNDYFSPRVDFNPFTHTWSLAVEEQFYLLFPCLFIAWLWGRRQASAALFTVALIASFVCAWWLSSTNPTQAFYFGASRFWELAAGVLLFQYMELSGRRNRSAT